MREHQIDEGEIHEAGDFCVSVDSLVTLIAPAFAQVIDFETTPSGSGATDNAPLGLSDAYMISGVTVTMGFDTDSDDVTDTEAEFELIGGADSEFGFGTCSGVLDTADPGFESQLGMFFLRQPISGGQFGTFVIAYSGAPTVTRASGEIWDIDGGSGLTEQFSVRAFDGGGNLLEEIVSPAGPAGGGNCGSPLDAQPWVFSFEDLTSGIARITITFTGTKTSNIGLAFNNFNATGAAPTPIPTLSGWGSLLLALVLMASGRRLWRPRPGDCPTRS